MLLFVCAAVAGIFYLDLLQFFKKKLTGHSTYKLYTHLVLCNVRQYGGSGIVAPVDVDLDEDIVPIDEKEYFVCYKIYLKDYRLARTKYYKYKEEYMQEKQPARKLAMLNEAKNKLIKHGFHPESIDTKLLMILILR